MAGMAYLDEEEVWKCPAHPSKRRRYGVCPTCLREKLSSLCPDCAALRPCSCSSSASSSSSSSSSTSSFSRFFSSRSSSVAADRSVTGKVSSLIDSEPSFRRSRSVASMNLPSFLRSRSRFGGGNLNPAATPPLPTVANATTSSFWGKFRRDRGRRSGGAEEEERRTMMTKSRSVAVTSRFGGYNHNYAEGNKGRSWSRYFPSPMKVFGSHKRSSSRSPLYRG